MSIPCYLYFYINKKKINQNSIIADQSVDIGRFFFYLIGEQVVTRTRRQLAYRKTVVGYKARYVEDWRSQSTCSWNLFDESVQRSSSFYSHLHHQIFLAYPSLWLSINIFKQNFQVHHMIITPHRSTLKIMGKKINLIYWIQYKKKFNKQII